MILNKSRMIAIIVAAVVIGAIATAFSMGLFTVEKKPEVKFVTFNREGTIELKQGEQLPIEFNIVNREQVPVSQVSVKTTYDGGQDFFSVDRPDYQIVDPIGADEGQSGKKTVIVTGNVNTQSELVANFKVTLYVGDIDTDTKTFSIRLKK